MLESNGSKSRYLKLHNCSARTTRQLVKEDDRLAEDEGSLVLSPFRIDVRIEMVERVSGEVLEAIQLADVEERVDDIRRMVEDLIDAGEGEGDWNV